MKYFIRTKIKRFAVALGIFLALFALVGQAQTAFVYDTGTEMLTSADFNNDGIADVLLLDKLTGNLRLGLLDRHDGRLPDSESLRQLCCRHPERFAHCLGPAAYRRSVSADRSEFLEAFVETGTGLGRELGSKHSL